MSPATLKRLELTSEAARDASPAIPAPRLIEAAAIARAAQRARADLGETIFDHLHAESCRLRGADIEVLAFGPGLHDIVAPPIDPSLHLGSRPL
jgi:hypothetical protein